MLDVKRNLTTMTDFYELTMSAGYLDEGYVDKIAVFDMFFRRVPDGGGYAVMAGLQQFIDAVDHLEFTDEDIDYLRSTKAFDEKFLTYLANFKLHCNIWAIEEGMPIFPQEPIVTVEGPAIECQLLETLLLVTFNHQCLIATKANRIVRSAAGRPVMEFGARRAQGYDAAYFGARASYIGGCGSTSCVMAARDFGIPASGTMAHSWVQMFPTEYDAFKKYAEMYPDACVLLVDTYNVLRHGVPDAIKVFDEVLKPMGKRPKGIRIDSGDIAYLSKKARKMLDEAGYPDCTICASNSLDEYIVRDLILQGARVDSFGIGENMNKMLLDEVVPILPLDQEDCKKFAAAVQDRFNNPFVNHELMSISLNSTSKWRARNMPSFLEYVGKNGKLPTCLTMSFAAYIAFYSNDVQELTDKGLVCKRAKGNEYTVSDDRWVLEFYNEHKNDDVPTLVHAVMTNEQMWGQDLTKVPGFEEATVKNLTNIRENGALAAYASCL